MLFLLDANLINARQEDTAVNELERLCEQGHADLEFAEIAYMEASKGSDKRACKAAEYTWSGATKQFESKNFWREAISEAVFPGQTLTVNQRNDVENLLVAKLTNAIFVSRDGASRRQPRGILGSREQLKKLGVQVVSPEEAVSLVLNYPFDEN